MEAHPCTKESILDSVWRYVNEIDFRAQKRMENFVFYSQIVVAVVSYAVSYQMQSF